ncbi:MAG: hypothetical protein M1831_001625, partial [Alyxoria varia]
ITTAHAAPSSSPLSPVDKIRDAFNFCTPLYKQCRCFNDTGKDKDAGETQNCCVQNCGVGLGISCRPSGDNKDVVSSFERAVASVPERTTAQGRIEFEARKDSRASRQSYGSNGSTNTFSSVRCIQCASNVGSINSEGFGQCCPSGKWRCEEPGQAADETTPYSVGTVEAKDGGPPADTCTS